jgi:hypothetical protein
MGSTRVDQAKVPSDLWARRVWVPVSGNKPSLVEVTDRNRLLIGAAIMILGFVVVAVVRAEHFHWAYAVSALILEVIGGLIITGGKRGGFYVLAPDGGLGEYLGKNKPDLKSMRGTRV